MRIVLFANGWVGWKVAQFLRTRKDAEIVGLVIHAKKDQKYTQEILKAVKLPKSCIFDGTKLDQPKERARLASLKAEMGVSIYYLYILTSPVLKLFPRGCVNLHPSFLPWNRGTNTNIWSIVEPEGPAGVTLHMIDEKIDTGAILAQKKVPVEPIDDGRTLYLRLQQAAFALFKKSWPALASGKLRPKAKAKQKGSYHRFRDVDALDALDLKKTYTGRQLIDILRARTFPPYTGAYILHGKRKIYLRLSLSYGR